MFSDNRVYKFGNCTTQYTGYLLYRKNENSIVFGKKKKTIRLVFKYF